MFDKKFLFSLIGGMIVVSAVGVGATFGIVYGISDNGKQKPVEEKLPYEPNNNFNLDNPEDNDSVFTNEMLNYMYNSIEKIVINNKITVGDKTLATDVSNYCEIIYEMMRKWELDDGNLVEDWLKIPYHEFNLNECDKTATLRFELNPAMKNKDIVFLNNQYINLSEKYLDFNFLSFSSPESWFVWDEVEKEKIIGLSEVGKKQEFILIPKKTKKIEQNFNFNIANNTNIKVLYFNDEFENNKQIQLNEKMCENMVNLRYVKLPKNLKENNVPFEMFKNCINLKEIKNLYLSKNEYTKKISSKSFENTGIVDICLDDGFDSILKEAFINNKELKRIRFGRNTKNFENNLFVGCDKLERIEFHNQNVESYNFFEKNNDDWNGNVFFGIPKECKIYVPNLDVKMLFEKTFGFENSRVLMDNNLNDYKHDDETLFPNDVIKYEPIKEKELSEIENFTNWEQTWRNIWRELNEYIIKYQITIGDSNLTTDISKHIDNFYMIVHNTKFEGNIRGSEKLEKPIWNYSSFNKFKCSTLRFKAKSGFNDLKTNFVLDDEDITSEKEYIDFNYLNFSSPKSWFQFDKFNKNRIKGMSKVGRQQEIIMIPNNVKQIKNNAFEGVSKTKVLYFNNAIVDNTLENDARNGNYICKNMSGLQFVKLSRDFKVISKGMFQGTFFSTWNKIYENSIEKIKPYAFSKIIDLKIEKWGKIKELGDFAFSGNRDSIKKISFEFDEDIKIGKDLFKNNSCYEMHILNKNKFKTLEIDKTAFNNIAFVYVQNYEIKQQIIDVLGDEFDSKIRVFSYNNNENLKYFYQQNIKKL